MLTPYGKTKDGFEMQFGINHLGHFALTGQLIGLLLATKKSRIITVSSGVHLLGRIDFNNLNAEKSYNKIGAYALSKLANLSFTFELHRLLTKTGTSTIAVAAHPGWAATNLQQHTGFFNFLNQFF